MIRRPLGSSGLELSAVGVGAMSFAGVYGEAPQEACHAVLDAALDLGIDHIDTSNVYGMGRSEEIIGNWIRARGNDNPYRIATKAGIHRAEGAAIGINNEAAHLEAELDKSLKRLGVEQVELFYLHRKHPDVEIEPTIEAMAALVKKGKTATIGLSEVSPTTLERAARIHPIAAVQSEYSLQTRYPELGLVQACERLGTTLVAFCPLGRGLLTDTPPNNETAGRSSFLRGNPRYYPDTLARNLSASQPIRDLAGEKGFPAAAIAIAWVLAQSPNVVTIPGTKDVAHLRELARGGEMMPPEVIAEINHRLPPGWCHGDRYSEDQWVGPERYC